MGKYEMYIGLKKSQTHGTSFERPTTYRCYIYVIFQSHLPLKDIIRRYWTVWSHYTFLLWITGFSESAMDLHKCNRGYF